MKKVKWYWWTGLGAIMLLLAAGAWFLLDRYQCRQAERKEIVTFILNDLLQENVLLANYIESEFSIHSGKIPVVIADEWLPLHDLDEDLLEKINIISQSDYEATHRGDCDSPHIDHLSFWFHFFEVWEEKNARIYHVAVAGTGVYYYEILFTGYEIYKLQGLYDFAVKTKVYEW